MSRTMKRRGQVRSKEGWTAPSWQAKHITLARPWAGRAFAPWIHLVSYHFVTMSGTYLEPVVIALKVAFLMDSESKPEQFASQMHTTLGLAEKANLSEAEWQAAARLAHWQAQGKSVAHPSRAGSC